MTRRRIRNGAALRAFLDDTHITVAQIAEHTGLNENTLYASIRRDSKISEDTEERIMASVQDITGQLMDTLNWPGAPLTGESLRALESELEQFTHKTLGDELERFMRRAYRLGYRAGQEAVLANIRDLRAFVEVEDDKS